MIIVHVLPLRSSSIYPLQQVSTQNQGYHIDLNPCSGRLAEDFSLYSTFAGKWKSVIRMLIANFQTLFNLW